jgi:hypothetical protein
MSDETPAYGGLLGVRGGSRVESWGRFGWWPYQALVAEALQARGPLFNASHYPADSTARPVELPEKTGTGLDVVHAIWRFRAATDGTFMPIEDDEHMSKMSSTCVECGGAHLGHGFYDHTGECSRPETRGGNFEGMRTRDIAFEPWGETPRRMKPVRLPEGRPASSTTTRSSSAPTGSRTGC